jgi:hypothetical protein
MTVSTTAESMDRRGWCVSSWTIEDVPIGFYRLHICGRWGGDSDYYSPSLITIVLGGPRFTNRDILYRLRAEAMDVVASKR